MRVRAPREVARALPGWFVLSPFAAVPRPAALTRVSAMSDHDDPAALSAEDAKLVTLARATRVRARADEGAAVRDLDGRTYAAASVRLEHLRPVRARGVRGDGRGSSGSSGLEAAVVLTDGDLLDTRAVATSLVPGVPVLVGDPAGRIHTRSATSAG